MGRRSWEIVTLIEGIVESLFSSDPDFAMEAFINQVGEAEILENLSEDSIREHLGEQYDPEDLFTRDELDNWADETYGFDYMEEVRRA